MSNTAGIITILAAFFAAFGGWSYWLKEYLNTRFDASEQAIRDTRTDLGQRLDRIDQRLDRIETGLGDHGERIARLEAR